MNSLFNTGFSVGTACRLEAEDANPRETPVFNEDARRADLAAYACIVVLLEEKGKKAWRW